MFNIIILIIQFNIDWVYFVLIDRMFGMVLEKIIIPEIQKVSGNVEKKICAVGITKLLTECPPMMDTEYTKLWQVLHSQVLRNYSFLSCDCKTDQAYFLEGQENLVLILAFPLATIKSKT